MKKHLIAAAVAGALAVPAMAQVTVSGLIDVVGYSSDKKSSQASSTAATITDSDLKNKGYNGIATPQIAISGSEDIGGGMKASFTINTGLFTDGGTSFGDRDRTIALSGGFGEIKLGQFVPAAANGFHGYTAASSSQAGTTYTFANASSTTDLRFGDDLTAGSFERDSYTMQYTTPSIGGLVANIAYRHNTTADASNLAGETGLAQTSLHVGYSAGAMKVGVGMNTKTVKAEGTTAATAGDEIEGKLNWLGASYNLGMATVGFAHIQRQDETTTAAGATTKNSDIKTNVLGVTVPMGATTTKVSYYKGENAGAAGATDDLDLSGYQLSVTYALSKRTNLYAILGQSKVERGGTNTGAGAYEEKTNAIGVTHSF
jgi:predicted porin